MGNHVTKESVTLFIPHHVKDVVTQILQFFRHLPFIQSSVFASAAGGGMVMVAGGKVNLVPTGPGQTMTRYWPLESGVGLCQLTFCHHIYPDLRLLHYLATIKISAPFTF